jgi:hypothetical protein
VDIDQIAFNSKEMERQAAAPKKTRDTFSIIHDDEFRPLDADQIEGARFEVDIADWQDSWKRKPPDVFRNQLRIASNPTDAP